MNLSELKSLYEEPLGEFRDTVCKRVYEWSMAAWREPSIKGAEFLVALGTVLSSRIEELLESEKQLLQSTDRIRLEVLFLIEYEQKGSPIKDDLALYCTREKRMEEYRAYFGWQNLFSLTCPLKSLQPSGLEQFLKLYRNGKLDGRNVTWDNEGFLLTLKKSQSDARSMLGMNRFSFPTLSTSLFPCEEKESGDEGRVRAVSLTASNFPFLDEELEEAGDCNSHLSERHRALFDRVEDSLSQGFSALSASLTTLHVQLVMKVRAHAAEQTQLLASRKISLSTLEVFEDDVRRVERSLSAFQNHADNLSHIKLTLSRAAALVSKGGPLESLLKPPNVEERFQCLSFTGARRESVSQFPVGFPREPLLAEEARDYLVRLPREENCSRIPNSTCFVFYLPASVDSEMLRRLFRPYGTVLNAYVAIDRVTNRTRGFGFVDFSTPSEASDAVQAMDKYPIDGKFLSVSIKV